MDFTTSQPPRELCSAKRTSLLLASRRIHSEAQIVLYQVNEIGICIDYDYESNRDNISIMGRPGYRAAFGLPGRYTKRERDDFFKNSPTMEMFRHMQLIHLQVGAYGGITEDDIVPAKRQRVSGPERPAYRSLVEVVKDVCGKLKECHQIHVLRVSVRSIESKPGSVEKVMDPIRSLRRIRRTTPVVFAMQDDKWVDWNLKGSYGRYMNKIMALPEGTTAPKYVGDEQEPNQNDRNIFDTVGGKWLGGTSFAMPVLDEDYDDDLDEDVDMDAEDAWVDEEDDSYEMFREAMDAMDNDDFGELYYPGHGGDFGPGFTMGVPLAHISDDGGLLGNFVPSAGLANPMNIAIPVPGLHEHLFGPSGLGLHHCHHPHNHNHYDGDEVEW